MMLRSQITQWGVDHPWQNENQIEQDLLLSMANKPDGVNGELMLTNLAAKLMDRSFCTDVDAMVKTSASAYDPQKAGSMVAEKLLRRIG